MNKRVLLTITIYITTCLILILAMIYSSAVANNLITHKIIDKQFNDSHILELKNELTKNQILLNTTKDNEIIRLGPYFYAIKSTFINNDIMSKYSTVTSEITFYYTGTSNSIGHLSNISSFLKHSDHVSIIDISSNNNYLGPWQIKYTGTGPAIQNNKSITSSVLFNASIPNIFSEDFDINSTITFSKTGEVMTEWQLHSNSQT